MKKARILFLATLFGSALLAATNGSAHTAEPAVPAAAAAPASPFTGNITIGSNHESKGPWSDQI